MTELRVKVLEGTLKVFQEKGIKFTMDDIAKELSISKKTIYTVTENKNSLILEMVNYSFDKIKEEEAAVLADDSLDMVTKIKKILGVLPDGYKDLDLSQLYMLKEKYPKAYKEVEKRLESGWENTIALLEEGKKQGVIRDVNIPILKAMFEASLEQFFKRDILKVNHISYNEALSEVVNIIVEGIVK